jgi:Secretion system C-terminal sorting domain
MTSRWRDGSPLTYGSDGTSTTNTPTKFAFPAKPTVTDTTKWNMPNSKINTLEKALILSCGPFKMLPGSRHRLSFGVVTDVDVAGHPRPNIDNLIAKGNRLKTVCAFPTPTNETPNEKKATVTIVPNPVFDEANVQYDGVINRFSVFNLSGQLVSEAQAVNSSFLKFSTQNMGSGIYIYRIVDERGKNTSGRFTVVR